MNALRWIGLAVGSLGVLIALSAALIGLLFPWPEAEAVVRSHGIQGFLVVVSESSNSSMNVTPGGKTWSSDRSVSYVAFPDSLASGKVYSYASAQGSRLDGHQTWYGDAPGFYGTMAFDLFCAAILLLSLRSFRRATPPRLPRLPRSPDLPPTLPA